MRLTLHVTGMFVFGAAALVAGAGLLHHARLERPVPRAVARAGQPIPRGTTGGGTADGALLSTAADALAGTLESAADAFDAGRRTDGVVALDAAYRVSDVLNAASPSGAPAQLFAIVEAARVALEDGSADRAATMARSAVRLARSVPAVPLEPPGNPEQYGGATAFSASGDYLGEVRSADGNAVAIESGGLRHILGFITLTHGSRRQVPLPRVVFGERRTIGMTMVVVLQDPGAGQD